MRKRTAASNEHIRAIEVDLTKRQIVLNGGEIVLTAKNPASARLAYVLGFATATKPLAPTTPGLTSTWLKEIDENTKWLLLERLGFPSQNLRQAVHTRLRDPDAWDVVLPSPKEKYSSSRGGRLLESLFQSTLLTSQERSSLNANKATRRYHLPEASNITLIPGASDIPSLLTALYPPPRIHEPPPDLPPHVRAHSRTAEAQPEDTWQVRIEETLRQKLREEADEFLREKLHNRDDYQPLDLEIRASDDSSPDSAVRPSTEADDWRSAWRGPSWGPFKLEALFNPRCTYILSSDVGTGKTTFVAVHGMR